MEFFLACFAAQFRKRVVTAMNDRETDHAVFYALETLVNVAFPQNETIHYASILKPEK